MTAGLWGKQAVHWPAEGPVHNAGEAAHQLPVTLGAVRDQRRRRVSRRLCATSLPLQTGTRAPVRAHLGPGQTQRRRAGCMAKGTHCTLYSVEYVPRQDGALLGRQCTRCNTGGGDECSAKFGEDTRCGIRRAKKEYMRQADQSQQQAPSVLTIEDLAMLT